jgi:hydroxyacylglutathione hydrolase
MLRKIVVGPYQTNCYIVGCKATREGVVIDPGSEVDRIVKEISRSGLRIRYILITHGHHDHTGGVRELKPITGAQVCIHPLDAGGLPMAPDRELSEGKKIPVGTFELEVIHTPGHSPGGVCFHAPGVVFSGDTLFAGSIGRTDFRGGDHKKLIQGVVRKIFPLGDGVRVYPGHGPRTTIGNERRHNPFFQKEGDIF